VIPLVAVMVWMGIFTQTFLPPVSESNDKILTQIRMSADLKAATHSPVASLKVGANTNAH
jgi:hypothetical protein